MKNITPTTQKNITSFWRWFLNHETELLKALLYKENYNDIFDHLNKKLKTISNQIGYVIKDTDNPNQKLKIIFTAHGNKNLKPKVEAIIQYKPNFLLWQVESFIKPIEDIEQFKLGLDEAYIFPDFELKTSEAYFSNLDYNIEKKKLNLIVYLKNYRFHFDNSFLPEAVYIMLEDLVGEMAVKKHIDFVQLAQLSNNPRSLVRLYELREYIERLCLISRKNNSFLT
jgi:hypothetical protein